MKWKYTPNSTQASRVLQDTTKAYSRYKVFSFGARHCKQDFNKRKYSMLAKLAWIQAIENGEVTS